MLKAAGTIFVAKDTQRILMNYRSQGVKTPHTWGFWGGKIEEDERILEGLSRELREEMGGVPDHVRVVPIDLFRTIDDNFRYHSFITVTEAEFIPSINGESGGWGWFNITDLPKPLHPGAFAVLKDKNFLSMFGDILKDS